MTKDALTELAKVTAKLTKEAIERAQQPVLARIADLEGRLVAAEKRQAGQDNAIDANRKHVQTLERKVGSIVGGKSA